MIPTPSEVAPLISCISGPLNDALRAGLAYADSQQPDAERDPYFWATCARFVARKKLMSHTSDEWILVPNVGSLGIHLRVADWHVVRVLRSLRGGTPPPGRNRRRRLAYIQEQLPIRSAIGGVPPLSLIADWQDADGEPIVHLGLPAGTWDFGRSAQLHWRIPLIGDGVSLDDLAFEPEPDEDFPSVTLRIDPSEDAAQ